MDSMDTSTPPAAPISTIQASLMEKFPRLRDELAKYPLNLAKCPQPFRYGTAGFRTHADLLESPLHRMGMLAVLRSRSLNQIVGVMITASHNLGHENGLKLIDGSGHMLCTPWERHCESLANASGSVDQVVQALSEIIAIEHIDLSTSGNIFIARDTRVSSESLAEVVREGALAIGGNVLDFALQTTPQLHHYVRMWNFGPKYNHKDWASESGYYAMLSDGYQRLLSSSTTSLVADKGAANHQHLEDDHLYIDAAHGVGALQVEKLAKVISANKVLESSSLTVDSSGAATSGAGGGAATGTGTGATHQWHIRNTPTDGELNVDCGAEYCQKSQCPPAGFSPESDVSRRCCSLDGDADRLVYHYFDTEGQWHLLDGDKIAAFIATFFREHCLTLKGCLSRDEFTHLDFGVVQTAYANGASTKYIRALGLEPAVAKTGVKFCHELATSKFDIGLYMEANGHGTVLFQDDAVDTLQKIEATCTNNASANSVAKKKACVELLAAYQIMNQSVGDAMSLILMIESLLRLRGWSIQQWDAMYADYPSRQTKLPVKDRQVIQCNASETQVISPLELQEEINSLVNQIDPASGRAFVRPSGTEDVVRIYAEASSVELADQLALAVAKAVYHLAGGVGNEEPQSFLA